eukprot:597338-Pyramimonas_sp.AAC.1
MVFDGWCLTGTVAVHAMPHHARVLPPAHLRPVVLSPTQSGGGGSGRPGDEPLHAHHQPHHAKRGGWALALLLQGQS